MRIVPFMAAAFLFVFSGDAGEPRRGDLPKAGVKTPGVQIPASSLKAENEFVVDGSVAGIVFGDKVYITIRDSGALLPVVPKTGKAEETLTGLKEPCGGATQAFGGVWTASCSDGKLTRYDPKAKKISAAVEAPVADLPRALAGTADSLWIISDARTTLSRVDPEAQRIVAEVRLPAGCNSVLPAENALWITCPSADKLLKINTHTSLVEQRIEVAGEPVATTFGEGSIWVLTKKEGKVVRIDPKTNKPSATVDLMTPGMDGTLAFGEGAVWVSMAGFPVTRIDPGSDKVAQQFTGEGGGDIFVGAGSVWVVDKAGKKVRQFDPKRIRATLAE